MRGNLLFACFWLAFLTLSCKKTDFKLEDTLLGIDPVSQPDVFAKLLNTRGKYFEYAIRPGNDTSFRFTPVGYDSTEFYLPGEQVEVEFGLSNFSPARFRVDSVLFAVVGAKGHWKLPFQRLESNRIGFNFIVPTLARPAPFCIEFQSILSRSDTTSSARFSSRRGKVCFQIALPE